MVVTDRSGKRPRAQAQKPAEAKPPYTQTTAEKAASERLRQRSKREAPTPRFKVDYVEGTASIGADHEDPVTALILLADAMGTGDVPFAEGLLFQLTKASRTGSGLFIFAFPSRMALGGGVR